jgi:hypothetical protein
MAKIVCIIEYWKCRVCGAKESVLLSGERADSVTRWQALAKGWLLEDGGTKVCPNCNPDHCVDDKVPAEEVSR